MLNDKSLREIIIDWSVRFPIDRWWRKKYNISFNSKSHREYNFLDQLFEFEEEKLFDEFLNKEDKYVPGSGDWLKNSEETSDIESSIRSLRDEFKDVE